MRTYFQVIMTPLPLQSLCTNAFNLSWKVLKKIVCACRQEKFQEQAATERTQLDARLSRDAVERTREANRRVDHLKAHRLAPRTTQIHVPKESITLSLEGVL